MSFKYNIYNLRYNLENKIKSKNNNNSDEKIKKKFASPYIFKNIFCIC